MRQLRRSLIANILDSEQQSEQIHRNLSLFANVQIIRPHEWRILALVTFLWVERLVRNDADANYLTLSHACRKFGASGQSGVPRRSREIAATPEQLGFFSA
jgi:hypothetical protein